MRKLVIYSLFALGALVFAYFMQSQPQKQEVNIYNGEFIARRHRKNFAELSIIY